MEVQTLKHYDMADTKQYNSVVVTDEIYFSNKTIFGDMDAHPYMCECHDGIAYCTRIECDENPVATTPQKFLLGYPTMCEVIGTDRENACREFRNIPAVSPLNYHDIAVKYGRIGKWGFNSEELNIMDKLARSAKMDWFVTTTEGNFRDGETGKSMTARKALKDLVEGLADENLDALEKPDLIAFIRSLASIL